MIPSLDSLKDLLQDALRIVARESEDDPAAISRIAEVTADLRYDTRVDARAIMRRNYARVAADSRVLDIFRFEDPEIFYFKDATDFANRYPNASTAWTYHGRLLGVTRIREGFENDAEIRAAILRNMPPSQDNPGTFGLANQEFTTLGSLRKLHCLDEGVDYCFYDLLTNRYTPMPVAYERQIVLDEILEMDSEHVERRRAILSDLEPLSAHYIIENQQLLRVNNSTIAPKVTPLIGYDPISDEVQQHNAPYLYDFSAMLLEMLEERLFELKGYVANYHELAQTISDARGYTLDFDVAELSQLIADIQVLIEIFTQRQQNAPLEVYAIAEIYVTLCNEMSQLDEILQTSPEDLEVHWSTRYFIQIINTIRGILGESFDTELGQIEEDELSEITFENNSLDSNVENSSDLESFPDDEE